MVHDLLIMSFVSLTRNLTTYQSLVFICIYTFGALFSCNLDEPQRPPLGTDSKSLDRWTAECTQPISIRPKSACLRFEQFIKESCKQKNDDACVSLAIYQISMSDDLNVIKSAMLVLETSCANQIIKACVHLGIKLIEKGKSGSTSSGSESSVRRGMELLKDACEQASSALACTVRAQLFLSIGSSQKNTQVMMEGLKAHFKACLLGTVDSCHKIAQLRLQPDTEVKSKCEAGHSLLCAELDRRKTVSKGQRETSLKKILNIACQGNHALSCANLGWLYWRGEGLKIDRSKARILLKKSCMLGFEGGCKRLQSLVNK